MWGGGGTYIKLYKNWFITGELTIHNYSIHWPATVSLHLLFLMSAAYATASTVPRGSEPVLALTVVTGTVLPVRTAVAVTLPCSTIRVMLVDTDRAEVDQLFVICI